MKVFKAPLTPTVSGATKELEDELLKSRRAFMAKQVIEPVVDKMIQDGVVPPPTGDVKVVWPN